MIERPNIVMKDDKLSASHESINQVVAERLHIVDSSVNCCLILKKSAEEGLHTADSNVNCCLLVYRVYLGDTILTGELNYIPMKAVLL